MPFTIWPSARVTGNVTERGWKEKKFSLRRRTRSFDKAFVVFPQRKKLRSLTLYRRVYTHFSRRASIRVVRRGTGQLEKFPLRIEREREREAREKLKARTAARVWRVTPGEKNYQKSYVTVQKYANFCREAAETMAQGHRGFPLGISGGSFKNSNQAFFIFGETVWLKIIFDSLDIWGFVN